MDWTQGALQGRRVLVTGGAGFIGTAMGRAWAVHNQSWTVIDSLIPVVHGDPPAVDVPPGVDLVRADVRDAGLLREVVEDVRPDVVFHMAAETGTGLSLHEPALYTDVNVTGTATLLEALQAHLPERLVLTSSRAVYGEGAWRDHTGALRYPGVRPRQMLEASVWDFPGLTPVPSAVGVTVADPSNVYAVTKLAQEHLVRAWCAGSGVAWSILRLQNVYGPGQSRLNPYTGVVSIFASIAEAGKVIPVYEDGRVVRDFIHVDDVVRALALAAGDVGNRLVDVGSGVPVTIGEVAARIADLQGAPPPIVTGQYRVGDVRHAVCDPSTSDFWPPDARRVSLLEGLKGLVRHTRNSEVSG